jgi:type I restriction enzyme S subunit
MLTFPKHKNYRDSGLEWLGNIPSHWSLQSIRSVTDLKSERNRPDLPVLSVYREYGVLLKDSRNDNHNATSLDISNYKVVEVGDLVVNKMKAWQGSMGISDHQGIVSPAYITCRVDASKIFPKFLHYLLRSQPYIGVYNALSYGVRIGQWDMHYEDFKKIPLPIPNVDEQRRIAEFLDRKTSEIDQAIAQKQRLIELLQEQKAILINQAVTKGLNPNAPMRDSGVQWFGEIPEHWEVWRSKRLFSQRKEFAQSDDIQLSATQAYGVIPQEEYEDRIGRKVTKVFQHLEKRRHVEVGDFVISMRSFQGGLERAWAKGCIRSSYVVLKPSARVDIDFFSYVFKSQAYISALQSTANFIRDGQDLNFDNFCAIDLVLPPIEEQRSIAQALNVAVADNAKMAEQTQKEINLLQEFRQIVITNAVTGKMKV